MLQFLFLCSNRHDPAHYRCGNLVSLWFGDTSLIYQLSLPRGAARTLPSTHLRGWCLRYKQHAPVSVSAYQRDSASAIRLGDDVSADGEVKLSPCEAQTASSAHLCKTGNFISSPAYGYSLCYTTSAYVHTHKYASARTPLGGGRGGSAFKLQGENLTPKLNFLSIGGTFCFFFFFFFLNCFISNTDFMLPQ